MTKEEFEAVKALYAESGQSLKTFLQEIGVSYTTYHYWQRKTRATLSGMEMAPITIMEQAPALSENRIEPESARAVFPGVTVAFPNGLRAHFGEGSEDILMELLTQNLPSHVLLNDTMRYHLCPGRTDMRKGINTLIGEVKERMGADVRNGYVFIFIGGSRRLMKLLHAEDGGMMMYVKRLEAGRFRLPRSDAETGSYSALR